MVEVIKKGGVGREEIIRFIFDYLGKELLEKAKNKDSYLNGVQIRGSDGVEKVALGVSIDLEFLEKCSNWGANFVIVHHAIALGNFGHYINPVTKERLRILFDNDITLMGFHYVLDSHKEIGNNAQILKKIGARIDNHFHDEWGWVGSLPEPRDISRVAFELEQIFHHEPVKLLFGKKQVKRIAATSGGGVPSLGEMPQFLEAEIDLYVTGEVKESTPGLFKEVGINYLAFGHYDSEKFGVQALGKLIKEKFPNLEVRFIEVPNLF